MRILKALMGLPIVLFVLFFSGSHLTSCTKTSQDTVTVTKTIMDTTIVRDTTVLTDTVYDITSGLVAYYNFDGGNLNDSSGYGNNITFNNATSTTDRFGRANNAYLFNGSNIYMSVPSSSSLTQLTTTTFMAIININAFYTGRCLANQIFGKGASDSESGFYSLRFSDFATGCSLNPPNPATEYFNSGYGSVTDLAGGVIDDAAPVQLGQWYTIVFTYDGDTSRFYVNGQLQQANPSIQTLGSNTDPLYIGMDETPSTSYNFNGVIDEIRIYNRALDAKEVAQLSKVQE